MSTEMFVAAIVGQHHFDFAKLLHALAAARTRATRIDKTADSSEIAYFELGDGIAHREHGPRFHVRARMEKACCATRRAPGECRNDTHRSTEYR